MKAIKSKLIQGQGSIYQGHKGNNIKKQKTIYKGGVLYELFK